MDTQDLSSRIPGWGTDLAPENRPGVPRESRSGGAPDATPSLERQEPKVKIHLTVERPELTPVFGTTCPPRGLSGKMRDLAYQYGEGRMIRWLTLLAADRVDVVEGFFEDLGKGRFPRPIKEMGLKTELTEKHSLRIPRDSWMTIAAAGLLGAVAFGLLGRSLRR